MGKLSICLPLLFLYSIDALALDPKKQDVDNVTILSFTHINEVFAKLGLAACEGKPKDLWNEILSENEIKPCKYSKLPSLPRLRVPAGESGILNDQQAGGVRKLHTALRSGCDGRKTHELRFTYDLVNSPEGRLCGFELFIKLPGGGMLGIALNSDGEILKKVPSALAFDKHNNKKNDTASFAIQSGKGCFECHPQVSSQYDMPGHKRFWDLETSIPIEGKRGKSFHLSPLWRGH